MEKFDKQKTPEEKKIPDFLPPRDSHTVYFYPFKAFNQT